MELLITHHALLFDDSKRISGRLSEAQVPSSGEGTLPTLPRRAEQLPPPETAPELPRRPEQLPPSESPPALHPRPVPTPTPSPPPAPVVVAEQPAPTPASPPQHISDIEAHPPPLPLVLPSPKAKQQDLPPIAPVPIAPVDLSLLGTRRPCTLRASLPNAPLQSPSRKHRHLLTAMILFSRSMTTRRTQRWSTRPRPRRTSALRPRPCPPPRGDISRPRVCRAMIGTRARPPRSRPARGARGRQFRPGRALRRLESVYGHVWIDDISVVR